MTTEPTLPQLLKDARRLLEERGRAKKALQLLTRAPEPLAAHPEVMALRGRALLELGREHEAREALLAAAAASPPAVEALLDLGWWDLDEDAPEEARERAQRALAQADAPARAREEAWGLLIEAQVDLSDRPGLRAALEGHQREHGEHPAVLLGRGRLLFLEGHFDQALTALQAARKAAPAALAWWWEAVALERLERLAEAEQAYREACRLDPDTPRPVRIEDEACDALIEATLAELPDEIRAEVEATCTVARQDFPDPSRVRDEGVDPFLLGECLGTAERTRRGDPVGGQHTGLTEVLVYRRNLERSCVDREELEEELRITLLHELGHALGLDEDGVAALGLE